MEQWEAGRNGPVKREWRRYLRCGWLALLVPLLAYAEAIGWAYWHPPLTVMGSSQWRGSGRPWRWPASRPPTRLRW
mgnify:FL=1